MSNLSAEPSESAFETHVQLKRGTSSWEPDQQLTAGDLTSVAGPAKASCLSNVETLKGMAPSKTDSAEQWIRHRKAHEAEKNTRISLIEGYEGSAFLADLGNCLFDWKAASRRVGRSLTMAKESIKGVPEGDVKSAFDKALNDIEESHGYLRGLTMGKYAFRQKARAVLPSILGDGPRLYAGGDDQSSKSVLLY